MGVSLDGVTGTLKRDREDGEGERVLESATTRRSRFERQRDRERERGAYLSNDLPAGSEANLSCVLSSVVFDELFGER